MSAKLISPPGLYSKSPKLKGSRAKGLTYERTVGRRLRDKIESGEISGQLVSGQWISFEDKNGPGYCQLDHYIICAGYIVIVECKLTQSDAAPDQMSKLYKPLLEHIYGCPVICVQACKNIRHHTRNLIHLPAFLQDPRLGIFTWHYLT